MNNRDNLIRIFEDTENWCRENKKLAEAVARSIAGAKLYKEGYDFAGQRSSESAEAGSGAAGGKAAETAATGRKAAETEIAVTGEKSFAAALRLRKEYPGARIAVHNFASATNPGGGVRKGSTAQEECLCRCSTLFPVLNTERFRKEFYTFHRERHDVRYTDACIYAPDIRIIKTDTSEPERMPEAEWCTVDVLTCAAPNLRARPYNAMNPGKGEAVRLTDRELLEVHKARGRQILHVAADNGVELIVLGAFGCGAFCNSPEVVARAYREILPEFSGVFRRVEFAVYCRPQDSRNYDVFRRVLTRA